VGEKPKLSRRHFLIASGAFLAGTLVASCRKQRGEVEQAEESESRKGIESIEDGKTEPGRKTVKEMPILIQEMAGLGTRRPLTGGVPIAEGAAPQGAGFALRDHRGELVPLQTSVLSRWGEGRKVPGWAELADRRGTVAVALRDFWQQWPKSLEASPEGLAVGLFPRFEAGAYDHMEPWYKYQYLFDGNCYQLRTG
jgi:hypothetical protein